MPVHAHVADDVADAVVAAECVTVHEVPPPMRLGQKEVNQARRTFHSPRH